MAHFKIINDLTAMARREVEAARKAAWDGGVQLTELLKRVNQAATKLFPDPGESDGRLGRIRQTFTPRSFRHYQTLGCISAPEKDGRTAVYGYRHFLQALLVRRLLWERVPADRIAGLIACQELAELQDMICSGAETAVWSGRDQLLSQAKPSAHPTVAESWRRLPMMPGVELHLNHELPPLRPAEVRRLMEAVGLALASYRR